MKIKINHNGFHGYTHLTINLKGKAGDVVELTKIQRKRLGDAACGIRECRCGETLLRACLDFPNYPGDPLHIKIPTSGEIDLEGYYPRR